MDHTFIAKNNFSSIKQCLLNYGVSQRLYRELKNKGKILVNQQIANFNKSIELNDEITFALPPELPKSLVLDKTPIKILYEDEHWLIVDKPIHTSTVPGPHDREKTLYNRVQNYFYQKKLVDLIPHFVSRLDYDTSGCVLIAKDRFLQSKIQNVFLQKKYITLVKGKLKKHHDILKLPLLKDPNSPRYLVSDNVKAKMAITEYQVMHEYDDFTLVEVQLHSGKTHQIRSHFSYLGNPLVGDNLYGGPNLIDHQLLHAQSLCFIDPINNKIVQAKSNLPEEFKFFIQKIA